MATIYSVAWWNLENLFDHRDTPRSEKLQRAIGADLTRWTPSLRDRKINQLGAILEQLNEGAGPDLLGVCEVENARVLRMLAKLMRDRTDRRYVVAHASTRDKRGIDVAFVYDSTLLTLPKGQLFQHVVMRRTATREILQANFRTHRDRTWTVLANHWPSRRGGRLASEGYRQIAGETLAYFHQRAKEVHGDDTPVLVMGDFNDEPFDRSLVDHALSVRQKAKVVNARSRPLLLNMMWGAVGRREGTFYFESAPNVLDQFLVNGNMLRQKAAIQAIEGSARIRAFPEMTDDGAYPGPVRFGGHGGPANRDGFSDHFPIEMQVIEAS